MRFMDGAIQLRLLHLSMHCTEESALDVRGRTRSGGRSGRKEGGREGGGQQDLPLARMVKAPRRESPSLASF